MRDAKNRIVTPSNALHLPHRASAPGRSETVARKITEGLLHRIAAARVEAQDTGVILTNMVSMTN